MNWNPFEIEIIRTEEQLWNLFNSLKKHNFISLDIETYADIPDTFWKNNRLYYLNKKIKNRHVIVPKGEINRWTINPLLGKILGIGLCGDDKKAFYIPLAHKIPDNIESTLIPKEDYIFLLEEIVGNFLKEFLKEKIIIAHNVKFDYKFLKTKYKVHCDKFWDTMVAWGIYDDVSIARHELALKTILSKLYQKDFKKWSEFEGKLVYTPIFNAAEYCCTDVIGAYRVFNYLKPIIDKEYFNLFYNIEMKLTNLLTEMELRGVIFDINYCDELSSQVKKRISKLENNFKQLSGKKDINIKSSIQTSKYLFGELKLKTSKKTPKGNPCGDEESLKNLLNKYSGDPFILSLINILIEYRDLAKIQDTYLDGLKSRLDSDGKFRTNYSQIGTVSGRFTAKPTLQTLPKSGEYNIRKLFLPEQRNIFVIADYSQMELRLAATISKDKVMFNALKNDEDLHLLTAKGIYNTENPTKEERYNAKQLNFAVLYGAEKNQVSKLTGQNLEESKKIINKFYSLYKGFTEWKDKIEYQIELTNKCKTYYGRCRHIDENSKIPFFKQKRSMLNSIIQGTGADILKMSLIKLYWSIQKSGLGNIVSHTHDEIIVECKKEDTERVKEEMKKGMELKLNELLLPVDFIVSDTFSKEEKKDA